MSIKRINEFPDGSGSLSNDDVFLFMDDPSGSGITKKISLSDLANKTNENINLSSYALLYSPNFSGVPTVPTAPSGTNTSQIANTSFVRGEINNLVDAAPAALDTLNELAAALNDDSNFASTVTNSLAEKASLSGATFTGTISGPSGNFTTLQQNGIGVSVSGHTHSLTDIPQITSAGSGIITASSYSAQNKLGWTIVSSSITGVAGGQYLLPKSSVSINNTITISDPTTASDGDFYTVIKNPGNIAMSGTIIGGVNYPLNSGIIVYRIYNIDNVLPFSASWKSYTLDTYHKHVSSDITNFNSTVSGLLPVKSILGSGNINVSSISGNFTVSSSGLVKSDFSNMAGASGINNIVQISQASYDALVSKDPNTIYFII